MTTKSTTKRQAGSTSRNGVAATRNGAKPVSAAKRQPTPLFEVRNSAIHGSGGFALRKIKKGRRIVEYKGNRISQTEADERWGDDDPNEHAHTFLFTIDEDTVIDPTRNGNEARFINHSCAPNCRSMDDRGRIYIEAVRDIAPGEELTYDYRLTIDARRTKKLEQRYACRCGARRCRGTQLAPVKKPR